jgi:DNA-binding NtrC family response regulator
MHHSGSTILIIDDALERRAHLQGICEFLELQCHVFDFVTWLQEGKRFPLAGVGVIFLGESSLPISLSKLVAELDLPGQVMPKVLVSRQSELAGESDQTPGLFGPLSEPYRYTEMLDILHRCSLFVSQQGGDPVPELDMLVGQSPPIQEVKRLIAQVAQRDISVMITGESGTGKEVVARCLHEQSLRAEGPFVPVNCGAIPGELLESELFGHEKGAFTGAISSRAGRFELAQGGTLFLDEVADLPLAMQVKLLRAIQEKAVRPVGDTKEVPVDIRVLSATHKYLPELVQEGSFRQDLFYRINVIELAVPSLRERPDDIPLLSTHILKRMAQEYECEPATLASDAIAHLQGYDFPGNVRELENILERAFTLCDDDEIGAGDLQLGNGMQAAPSISGMITGAQSDDTGAIPVPEGEIDLEGYLESIERQAIEKALEATRWNKTAAAKRLGISFRALRYRLKKLGME